MTKPPRAERASLDALALELQHLRAGAGMSYRAIAVAVAQRRAAAGAQPAAAFVAHSTIADVFRLGRSRINAPLVAEIVAVLGGDPVDWRERCVQAMSAASATARDGSDSPGAAATRPVRAAATAPVPSSIATRPFSEPGMRRPPWCVAVGIVFAALMVNAAGKFFNPLLGDVLFFDMIGTAVAALLLGAWWAALVGVLFIAIEMLKGNTGDALFAITMLGAAIIWGLGAQRGWAGTMLRFAGVSVIVAVATSAIAVPITVLYYRGRPGRGFDQIIGSVAADGELWWNVSVINLAVSILDKVVVGTIALLIARAVARSWPALATMPPTQDLPRAPKRGAVRS